MKRACLSETRTPVARQVTQGLEAQGWNVRLRTEGPAPDLRVEFLEAAGPLLGPTVKADCSSLVLVAPAAGRMGLAGLSLHTQQLAVAAAPSQRVNAIAFEAGHTDKLAVTIDWLAKASMVTGQLILLSDQPAPYGVI